MFTYNGRNYVLEYDGEFHLGFVNTCTNNHTDMSDLGSWI